MHTRQLGRIGVSSGGEEVHNKNSAFLVRKDLTLCGGLKENVRRTLRYLNI